MTFEIACFAFVAAVGIAIWIDWDRFINWPPNLEIGFYIVPPNPGAIMNSLATDIRNLIAHRVQAAPASEVLAIASNLCAAEVLPELRAAPFEVRERFFCADDVTVSDRSSGLTWSRANVPGGQMNCSKAKEACAALELGGFKDWRLPTIKELLTLVDYERKDPAIDPIFECRSNWYWTSTTAACSPRGCAWLVDFNNGDSDWYPQGYVYYVRAVRSSQ